MANQCRITYERDRILGRGGYGTVFLGTLSTEGIKQQVAVKRILRRSNDTSSHNLSTKTEDREFIYQLKLGKHPNVVQLLHWEDQGEDFRFFALELCKSSLDKVLYADPDKLLPSQLELILQLSCGLEYIHSQNLIHRDIKPENVLISESSDGSPLVKWGDFGLSKEISRGQCIMSGKRGTDWYWAPEIWKMWKNNNDRLEQSNDDKKVMTIMSDIFSTGCVFFEFCTCGIHPFGEGEMEIKTNLSMEPSNPYNLKDFKLKESHFAYKIIKKMLENDPEVRSNLREITQSLLTLQKFAKIKKELKQTRKDQEMEQIEQELQTSLVISDQNGEDQDNPDTDVDKAQQKLEKMKIELHYLCSRSNPTEEQIRKIAEISAEDSIGLVNMVDDDGFSPLLLMCRNNRTGGLIGSINALLMTFQKEDGSINREIKVDVNYQDRNRFNALHYICSHHQGDDFLEILHLLIQCGIDVNRTQKEKGNNALQLFFRDNKRSTGVVQIVQALIKNGINLKHKGITGWTPLHHLCRYYTHNSLIEVAKLLVNNGVNVNAKTSNGWTALDHLCRHYTHNNLIDVAKLLVDNGVDVSAKQSDGWTALHFLCRHYTNTNLVQIIKLLIERGADPHINTQAGYSASDLLQKLSSYNHENKSEVLELLRNGNNQRNTLS